MLAIRSAEMKTPRPTKNAERGAPTKRQFTDITGLLALHSTINGALLRAWCATPSRWLRGTIRTKAKAPVLENTIGKAVATPHRQAGFCCVQILGTGAPAPLPSGLWAWWGLSARTPARLYPCFQPPCPPVARENASSGSQVSTRSNHYVRIPNGQPPRCARIPHLRPNRHAL